MNELKEVTTIKLDISETYKTIINVLLAIFVIGFSAVLLVLKKTKLKDDKNFKKYFNELYYNLAKYLFIEGSLVFIEFIEFGKFSLTTSMGRIAAVHTGLVLFYASKGLLGL